MKSLLQHFLQRVCTSLFVNKKPLDVAQFVTEKCQSFVTQIINLLCCCYTLCMCDFLSKTSGQSKDLPQ